MKRIFFNRILKNSLLNFFLPVFSVFSGLMFYVAVIELNSIKTKSEIMRENLLKENRNVIRNTMDQVYSDICFLTEMPEIKEFYSNEEYHTQKLQGIFSSFSRNKELYHQIRLIDTLGWEKVRVDLREGSIVVYNKGQLQNKSNRYYYHKINQLLPDKFYVSAFDLNIEHGVIEEPYVPVLRFGRSISDSVSKSRILFVVNFLGEKMLSELRMNSVSDSLRCLLLNQDGYYLIGPDENEEWRFSFSDSASGRFDLYYPEEWEAMIGKKASGHLKTKNGYFSFLKINLCDYFLERTSPTRNLIPHPCREWMLVSYLGKNEITKTIIKPILTKYLLFSLIGALVLIVFLIFYSNIRVEQLKEREERKLQYQFMNSLIETIPNPIFYFDHIRNAFDCNEAFEHLTGEKRSEIKDLKIEKLFDKSALSKKQKKPHSNTVKISEMRLKYPDGSIHNLLYYKANIISQARRIGLVGVFTDITEIRNTETALRESENKLRLANSTKDRFLSLIGHDLKNPFHAIMGLSHLLKTNYDEISDEDRKNIAENIYASTENTFQLLINLLDWARLQEGKIKVKTEDLELEKIARESIDLVRPRIKEKNLRVTHNIEFDLRVRGDKNMVRTIFRNLIGNAVKFTEDGGKIHVSAKRMLKYVEINIADTGIGINEEDLKYLFRLDKKGTIGSVEGQQGTGLGLILCKEFVEMNQGRIWAESEVGRGSVFYFALPAID